MLWTAQTLRPLLDQCIPVAEALALRELKSAALPVGPHAVKLVADKGGWNPVAVAALKESGAAVVAKHMNAHGVSAEYAPEVQLVAALTSIVGGHMMILNELKAMAREQKGIIDIQATQPVTLKTTHDTKTPTPGADALAA